MKNEVTFSTDFKKDYNEKTNEFIKYVYTFYCNCEDTCYLTPDAKKMLIEIKKSNSNCMLISIQKDVKDDYLTTIDNVIKLFINLKLIKQHESKYYIRNLHTQEKYKFTWNNIKQKQKNEDIKALFWLFRKCIVDSILKYILDRLFLMESEHRSVLIYSTGSSRITSDYDITLYGNPIDILNIIQEFKTIFARYFNESSGIFFDTNLYGTSWINYENNPNTLFVSFGSHVCNTIKFNYIKPINSTNDSQLVWALIGFYKVLNIAYGSDISQKIWRNLESDVKMQHITFASNIFEYITNQDILYEKLLYRDTISNSNDIHDMYSNKKELKEKYGKEYNETLEEYNKELAYYDYISLMNFLSDEAYLTRGAFMDIVVNEQICKKSEPVELTDYDLICSIIENLTFLFSHNTDKYRVRVVSSQKRLTRIVNTDLSKIHCKVSDNIYTHLENLCESRIDIIKQIKNILEKYSDIYSKTPKVPLNDASKEGYFIENYKVKRKSFISASPFYNKSLENLEN